MCLINEHTADSRNAILFPRSLLGITLAPFTSMCEARGLHSQRQLETLNRKAALPAAF